MVQICTFLMIFMSIYDDIREKKISVLPIVLCTMAGTGIQIYQQTFQWDFYLTGAIPGGVSYLISKIFGDCIGMGDILVIFCVGILNGWTFCLKFLFVSCICIFVFSMIMMILGKLHRGAQVACMPFFMLGYIGAWLL